MQINILFFGQLTDITGAGAILLDDISDTVALTKVLHDKFPALATSKYAMAVEKKIITENILLINNCTVALLPPFSGG